MDRRFLSILKSRWITQSNHPHTYMCVHTNIHDYQTCKTLRNSNAHTHTHAYIQMDRRFYRFSSRDGLHRTISGSLKSAGTDPFIRFKVAVGRTMCVYALVGCESELESQRVASKLSLYLNIYIVIVYACMYVRICVYALITCER